MANGLDDKRLGLVFQSRPDILAGIQQAAGKLCSRARCAVEICSLLPRAPLLTDATLYRFSCPGDAIQQHRHVRVRADKQRRTSLDTPESGRGGYQWTRS